MNNAIIIGPTFAPNLNPRMKACLNDALASHSDFFVFLAM